MKIGHLDAESDHKFLSECYVDKKSMGLLINASDSEALILGRTGAGKTASLLKIKEKVDSERSKIINLEEIFLKYIDNSNIIKFLSELNINLELFYKYLWRHILTIEFLKLKYPKINDKNKFSQLIQELRNLIRRTEEKSALHYLEQWSDKYWIESVENIEEIVKKFTKDVKAGFDASLFESKITAEAAKNITEDQKSQIENRVRNIVSDLQITELSKVISLLNEHIFTDNKKPYYILMDKLDENWVSIDVKYSLIKSLIEEIKYFRNINNVKILVSLRLDLYQLTLDKVSSHGFQEEKLSSYIYKLNWTDKELKEIVDKRINFLFKHQYSNNMDITFEDIFPSTVNNRNRDPWQYLITRTFWRPRDILQFINYCLEQAVDKSRIEWGSIHKAEKEYSKNRLKNLNEEWQDIYESLKYTAYLISNCDEVLSIDGFKAMVSDDALINIYPLLKKENINDSVALVIYEYIDRNGSREDIITELISCFYRIGIIGVSDMYPDSFDWSFRDMSHKTSFECSRTSYIKIHKMFHQALRISITSV
ncbi:P-loop ATPase, Sll1717 family [Psychrobacter sp. 1U2]|uniref:P-loop ATPase, Sll1717 family n=1 Tax=Psychrobacter sp. 1U2 TaxID=3453577 RepID=UPI003F44D2B7